MEPIHRIGSRSVLTGASSRSTALDTCRENELQSIWGNGIADFTTVFSF
jgi:hypothetical protein